MESAVLLFRKVTFSVFALGALFCTSAFSAISSTEYVDKHVENKGSDLATKAELAGKQDKGDYALKSDVPTKTSELTNDSGFVRSVDVPSVPDKVSELENDSGYITDSALSGYATTSSMNTELAKING